MVAFYRRDGHTCPVWLKSKPLGLVLDILDLSACGSFEFGTPGLVSWVFEPLWLIPAVFKSLRLISLILLSKVGDTKQDTEEIDSVTSSCYPST